MICVDLVLCSLTWVYLQDHVIMFVCSMFLCVTDSWDYGLPFWWSTPQTKQSSRSPSPTTFSSRSSPPASHQRTAFAYLQPFVSVSPAVQQGGRGERPKSKMERERKWMIRERPWNTVLTCHKQNHKNACHKSLHQAQGMLLKTYMVVQSICGFLKDASVHGLFTIFSQWYNQLNYLK